MFSLSPEPSPVLISHQDLVDRQTFILAKAPMYFGAPSHRIESQLVCVAYAEIDAQFVHMPSIIICSIGDQETKASETRFGGRLMFGRLHNVHGVYRSSFAVVTWMPRRGMHPNAMLLYFLVLLFHLSRGIQRLSIRRSHIRARSTSLFLAAGCSP